MTRAEAALIALGSETAGLGRPTKMPGFSFGLSAFECGRGGELAQDPTTTCGHCYARGGFYLGGEVVEAHKRRLAGLRHPRWVEAMVVLIKEHTDPAVPFFRWHDSGDLQGVWHLRNILAVADATPEVKHWLPTKEAGMVEEYLLDWVRAAQVIGHLRGAPRAIPRNVCIRVSADLIGKPPAPPPEGCTTSTVHRGHGARNVVQVSADRADSVECKAGTRGAGTGGAGLCGSCRACWDTRVRNVSYPIHGERKGRYQIRLPIVD